MAGTSQRYAAVMFVLLLIMSTSTSLLSPSTQNNEQQSTFSPDWVRFEVKEDVYFNAVGTLDESVTLEERAPMAIGPFGTFDAEGLTLNRPVPAILMEPRFDLLMLIASNEMRLQEVRLELNNIQGLAVREHVAPSGLMVQGTPLALQQAEAHPGLVASHAVPLGMLLDGDLLDVLLLEGGEAASPTDCFDLRGGAMTTGRLKRCPWSMNKTTVWNNPLGRLLAKPSLNLGSGTMGVTRGSSLMCLLNKSCCNPL